MLALQTSDSTLPRDVLAVRGRRGMSAEVRRATPRIVVIDAQDGATVAATLGAALRRREAGVRTFETMVVTGQQLPPTAEGDVLFVAESRAGTVVVERSFVVTSAAQRGNALTGVDVLGYITDGAAGVIDAGMLAAPETIDACVVVPAQEGGRFVIGEPAHRLSELYHTVIEDWPSDGSGELDRLCFRSALALAQVERLKRPVVVGRTFGATAYAAGLNLHAEKTGFRYTTGHLARALTRLGRIWAPGEVLDEADLRREPGGLDRDQYALLPDLARSNGFPRLLPTVRGIARPDVSVALWETLNAFVSYEEERKLGTLVLRLDIRATRSRGGQ